MHAAVLDIIDEFEPGAKLERVAFFRRPVILSAQIISSIFVSDDKTHTATYELPPNRLSRPEAQFTLGNSLK